MVTLLPLFYQTLMGYSANAAGLAVSPRGIGAILVMPLVGVLTSKLDNRWLIASGFAMFAFSSLWMANLTLQMSQWSMVWPIIISGMASGLVFVPLSTATMGTLRDEQIGNASGLYNLLRNIGGGIGISVVNTLVSRHQQLHRSELSHNLSNTPLFNHALQGLQNTMSTHAAPNVARLRAYAILNRRLDPQAAVYSDVDDFRYIAAVCVVCGVIVFFLKRVRAKKGAAPSAH